MIGFEIELRQNPCDLVIVVGDVTSTMACTIVAKKAHIKVAHVEAGIRSGDMKMPEEINRMVTDAITDYFYVTSEVAIENLKNIGKFLIISLIGIFNLISLMLISLHLHNLFSCMIYHI